LVSSSDRNSKTDPDQDHLLRYDIQWTAQHIAEVQEMSQIHNSHSAFNLLKSKFNPTAEEFWLLTLNSVLELTQTILISKGTLNHCPVHPRDLFRECIKANAFTFIIAHNHPSLDVTPSPEDTKLTQRLFRISKILEIPMADHIIFTDKNYFSLRENNSISWK